MTPIAIYCADIGSIKNRNFGWAVVDGDQDRYGRDIRDLVDDIVGSLTAGTKVALGFECPLWVPVPDDPRGLTAGRAVDGNKPWSAGAGASALAAGLTETAWVLRQIKRRLVASSATVPSPYFNWEQFRGSDFGVFLWEAFVTGQAKRDAVDPECRHIADALTACREFRRRLPQLSCGNKPSQDVRSLIGEALLWSGWSTDLDLLRTSCLVVRPTEPLA